MRLSNVASLEELFEAVDLLCIPAAKDHLDDIHAQVLSKLIPAETLPPVSELIANKNHNTLLYGTYKNKRIRILIFIENNQLTEGLIYSMVKKLSIRSKNEKAEKVGLIVHHLPTPDHVQTACCGWTTGQYDLGLYKQGENENGRNNTGVIYSHIPHGFIQYAENGITLGLVQHEVMTLVNLPASHKSPKALGEWAQHSAAQYGYKSTVLDKQQLFSLGMHALLAVNRGSEYPAQCIITQYTHPEAGKKIVLVGKGVIFDTGGVSIKTSKNMHYMKSDMAGAAAALGTVEACARLGLTVDVMAIAPTTDNSIDNTSLKPGDVIGSYAGKTIEVIDTDAEGRLILADALTYAVRQFKPDVMIDMATLTGSIVASLGPHAAGLFTKNDQLATELESAGTASGERVWRMPMYEEYKDDMQSDIADLKNLSEKPYAGAATAAAFLECFTDDHPNWAHLDIAGMAFQANGFGKSYCATAYGVRLLVKWMSVN